MKIRYAVIAAAVIGGGILWAAQDLVPGKWGSDLTERYRDLPGKGLTGLQISHVGGIGDDTAIYRETSWSPWLGDTPPEDNYVTAQGIVIMWWGPGPGDRMGYYWKRTADKKIYPTDYTTENIRGDSWPVSYFWGSRHEDSRYMRVGGCHYGAQNRTSRAKSVTVDIEWWPNQFFKDHWTVHTFTVQPTQTGYAYPKPKSGEFGYIADDIETVEEAQ